MAVSLLEVRRQILLNTPHIESVSGSIVTFNTDLSANLTDMKIHFLPVQEGTGDPSPDNVRPITGWDGVTVTRCGKNLFDKSKRITSRLIDSTGSIVSNSSWFVTDYIPLQGTKVSCHGSRRANITYHAFYDENKQLVSVAKQEGINNLTIPLKARYIRCSCANEYANAFQVELNSAPTSYEPYTSLEIPISFPQTIYGGYVDLAKGEVVEEWGYKDEGSLNWNHQNTSSSYPYGFYYVNVAGKNKGLSNILFSNYPVTSAVFSNDKVGFGNAQNSVIYIINSDYANVGDFKTAMNGQIISCELTTPNTYPLTPQTIKALKGINNIWSDANGDVEVKFWKH